MFMNIIINLKVIKNEKKSPFLIWYCEDQQRKTWTCLDYDQSLLTNLQRPWIFQ